MKNMKDTGTNRDRPDTEGILSVLGITSDNETAIRQQLQFAMCVFSAHQATEPQVKQQLCASLLCWHWHTTSNTSNACHSGLACILYPQVACHSGGLARSVYPQVADSFLATSPLYDEPLSLSSITCQTALMKVTRGLSLAMYQRQQWFMGSWPWNV